MVRGWLVRSRNQKHKDSITVAILTALLENYNQNYVLYQKINNFLQYKRMRSDNFPSIISENIVKYVLNKRLKILANWDTSQSGDLTLKYKRLEIKSFISDAPSSFGPNEHWDWLLFVDAKRHLEQHFTVYLVKLSNTSLIWQNIKVNKVETFQQQADQKRRPRIAFQQLLHQIGDYCQVIFSDFLSSLNILEDNII